MGEEVVRGPAVHSKADEARRALHAARRRRPPEPTPPTPTPVVPVVAEPVPPPPVDDAQVRALLDENRALRAQITALRQALHRLEEDARRALDG